MTMVNLYMRLGSMRRLVLTVPWWWKNGKTSQIMLLLLLCYLNLVQENICSSMLSMPVGEATFATQVNYVSLGEDQLMGITVDAPPLFRWDASGAVQLCWGDKTPRPDKRNSPSTSAGPSTSTGPSVSTCCVDDDTKGLEALDDMTA